MSYPNPKAMIVKYMTQRRVEKMGLGTVRARIAEIEDMLSAQESGLEHFDTREWKWFTQTFLPSELRRIEHERSSVPPGDQIRQSLVQGQVNEIGELTRYLPDMKDKVDELREMLNSMREVEAKLLKQKEHS